jgi:DNA-binding transcriptional MocR family regulator
VLVTPSTLYAVGSPRPGGLRLTYCLEPPARLKEGARRLSRALAVAEGRSRNEQDEAAPPMGLV